MKLGLLAGQFGPSMQIPYDLITEAESLGFESVWPVEHVVMPAHYSSRYPYSPDGRMPIPDAAIPDPLIWNTFVAAVTQRLLLDTAPNLQAAIDEAVVPGSRIAVLPHASTTIAYVE